jgi:hypothetical protein
VTRVRLTYAASCNVIKLQSFRPLAPVQEDGMGGGDWRSRRWTRRRRWQCAARAALPGSCPATSRAPAMFARSGRLSWLHVHSDNTGTHPRATNHNPHAQPRPLTAKTGAGRGMKVDVSIETANNSPDCLQSDNRDVIRKHAPEHSRQGLPCRRAGRCTAQRVPAHRVRD